MMTIKFRCPACGKVLSVKEGLAGRKAPCPACKAVLTIPSATTPGGDGASTEAPKATTPAKIAGRAPGKSAPAGKVPVAAGFKPPPGSDPPAPPPDAPANGDTPVDVDAETLAASVLADEPKPAETEVTTTITFNCPQCDDPMTVSSDLGGKQAPCPSCRRIVKVPLPVKKEPVDWRQPNKKLPSGARQNFETPELEGATTTTTVSVEALEEAGAIPDRKEKLTRVQLLTRVGAVVGVLLVLGLGGWSAWVFISGNAQYRMVRTVLQTAEAASKPGGKPELRRDAIAELRRASGEWFLRSGRRDGRDRSRDEFRLARSLLINRSGNDRDMLLMELAFSQLELGGSAEEVEAGTRLPTDEAAKELTHTLGAISSLDHKAFAVREVCRRLIERDQRGLARVVMLTLPAPSEEWRIEVNGYLGLELLRANPDDADIEKMAKRGVERLLSGGPTAKRSEVPPALLMLCYAKHIELIQALPELKGVDKGGGSPSVRQGVAVGMALKNELEPARMIASQQGLMRVQTLLEAASVLPVDRAKPYVEAAADLSENELKGRVPSWTLTRLAFVAVRCGLTERAGKIAAMVNDPALRGWAQLQVLRAAVEASSAKIDFAKADEVEKQSVCWFLARVALARHNTRHDRETRSIVDKWEEPERPFGQVGYALGLQDGP